MATAFDIRDYDYTGQYQFSMEAGNWTVLLFNVGRSFVARAPYAWSGLSRKAARAKLNELVRFSTSYDGQWEKISPFAFHCDRFDDGGAIYCMTDQEITFPVRNMSVYEFPI